MLSVSDFSPHVGQIDDLAELWSWIPNRTLFNLHLGFRGPFEKRLQARDPEAIALFDRVSLIKSEIYHNGWMRPKFKWQWFHCYSKNDQVILVSQSGEPVTTFSFPRQRKPPHHCLSDFISAKSLDIIGIMVTTSGHYHTILNSFIEKRRYQDALILHSLFVQSAEALSEIVHFQLRQMTGLSQLPPTPDDILGATYSGKRFSFGYSACPDLSGQRALFEALRPEDIGVSLTALDMMAPESSVSAMVFCHPTLTYFSV
jgi:5-methyltetrahydrofolate--homocysteine methyltransferase